MIDLSVEILTEVYYLILRISLLLKEHMFWHIKTSKGCVVEVELILVASGTVVDV